MKKIIGWFILVSLLIAFFVLVGIVFCWQDAFWIFTISIVVVVLVFVSTWLITVD